jgi:hypothetical protein
VISIGGWKHWLWRAVDQDGHVLDEIVQSRHDTKAAKTSLLWTQLEVPRDAHLELLADIDRRYHEFSKLDNQFHRLVARAVLNRFVDSF